MQPQAEQAGVTLSAQFKASNTLMLADVDRLKQALANLVENALKYTSAGGTVTLRMLDAPGAVTIEIADTGKGIPEEDLKRVTERFYQVDKSRTQEAEGRSLGLGLAIAQEIVHAHGGQISVSSREGVGTTVSVTLPAQESRQVSSTVGGWPPSSNEPKNGIGHNPHETQKATPDIIRSGRS
jgi:two-component system sensor histidine kinase ResE